MNKTRIVILFLAVAAAVGAFILATGGSPPPPPPVAAAAPAPIVTDDVLVAARNISPGTTVNEPELQWQSWPKDVVPPGVIRRSEAPKIVEELKGSIARVGLIQGEPIRREKLVKGQGFMSAMLPAGKRAVAINIDNQGATTAGGFIFPGDHVDVIHTYRDERKGAGAEDYVSHTVLENVPVRAIGPNIQEKDGQPVVVGSTATLELDPAQAEQVVLSQRTGQISLTLRSLLDIRGGVQAAPKPEVATGGTVQVVRYGISREGATP